MQMQGNIYNRVLQIMKNSDKNNNNKGMFVVKNVGIENR